MSLSPISSASFTSLSSTSTGSHERTPCLEKGSQTGSAGSYGMKTKKSGTKRCSKSKIRRISKIMQDLRWDYSVDMENGLIRVEQQNLSRPSRRDIWIMFFQAIVLMSCILAFTIMMLTFEEAALNRRHTTTTTTTTIIPDNLIPQSLD